ncbi:hypothetical protein FRC04_006090 [Tulasnella sp. 424]|nr:hypothetical protein FRC04_006090 [Tulasnella sp. 424]KAG8961266.1 hypothetical protein FRC05_006261 [Tulasnella sp. 425]
MLPSVLNGMHDNDSPQLEASSSSGVQRDCSTPSSSSVEPPPVPTLGPDYYELRRQEWLRPTTSSSAAANDAQSTSSSSSGTADKKKHKEKEEDSSRARLEVALNEPGAEENDELWKAYLHSVHDGLVGGKKFKKGIKLGMAVKILKAGWLRDGTWDTAAAASMNSIPTSSTITAAGPSTAIAQATSPTASSRRHSSATTATAGLSASRGLRALLTGGRNQHHHNGSIASSLPPPPPSQQVDPIPASLWTETAPTSPTTKGGQPTPPTSAGSTKSSFFGSTISRFLPAALVGKFVSSPSAGERRRHGRQARSESWPVLTKEPTAKGIDGVGGGEGEQKGDDQASVQERGTAAPTGLS